MLVCFLVLAFWASTVQATEENRGIEDWHRVVPSVSTDTEVYGINENGQDDIPPSFYVYGIRYDFYDEVQTNGQVDVNVYMAERPLHYSERQEILLEMKRDYPYVERIGAPTSAYNCHSYAWYSASEDNPYWIVDVDVYINDVHTDQISKEDCRAGDIIVYYDEQEQPVHSAVVTEIDGIRIMCISKWGVGHLCRHEVDDVPNAYKNNGTPDCRYYRIRPHNNTVSYNASTHTYSCSDCPYSITEPHKQSPLGICLTCGYSGNTQVAAAPDQKE